MAQARPAKYRAVSPAAHAHQGRSVIDARADQNLQPRKLLAAHRDHRHPLAIAWVIPVERLSIISGLKK